MPNLQTEVKIAIWTVALAIVLFLLLALFLYKPIKNKIFGKTPTKYFYRKILAVVRNNDFYLVNDFEIPCKSRSNYHIDHIIGGDKYIYLVSDYYFIGRVEASLKGATWSIQNKKGDKQLISNPVTEMRVTLAQLATSTRVSPSFFVGIVLINDDCLITPLKNDEKGPFVVPASKLKNVVAHFESSDVAPFNQEQLHQITKDLHDINIRNKNSKQ